jgi:recombination protein RecT
MAEQKKSTNALITMIDAKREGLWNLKASYLPNINQEVYFKRALITVMENKDLAALAKTEIGAVSILKAIGKALQMGLQIGGNIPQAYIVKFGEQAILIPAAEGYRFICTAEPDPVLRDFSVRAVYDGENFSLDYGSGTVKHTYDGKTKRGKLIGVYCQIEDLNGNRKCEYMTRDEIEKIRDTHSRYFVSTGKGPWKDDFDAMCQKTAAKKFLKPYAAMKEGLAMALAVDDGEPVTDTRPVQDRVGDHLDSVLDAEFEPAESAPPKEADAHDKPATEQPEKSQPKEGKKQLF